MIRLLLCWDIVPTPRADSNSDLVWHAWRDSMYAVVDLWQLLIVTGKRMSCSPGGYVPAHFGSLLTNQSDSLVLSLAC